MIHPDPASGLSEAALIMPFPQRLVVPPGFGGGEYAYFYLRASLDRIEAMAASLIFVDRCAWLTPTPIPRQSPL